METRKRQIIKLSVMILLTFTYFITEVVYGHLTGSLALIGDSYHMISDVVALIIGLFCLGISNKTSKQNTYGWARAEILGALINSIFLSSLCFTILIEALERLIHPHEIHEPDMLLIVGCVGLGVNLLGIVIFCNETHGHTHSHAATTTSQHKLTNGHIYQGSTRKLDEEVINYTCIITNVPEKHDSDPLKEESQKSNPQTELECDQELLNQQTTEPQSIESHEGGNKKRHSGGQMNIRGVFLHILGDALGSVVVIISALIVKYFEGPWTLRVDPTLSLIMVIIIFSSTFPLLKQSSLILLQHVPSHICLSDLSKKLLTKIPGLLGIHELHVWQLVGNRNVASLHIQCTNSESYELTAERIRDLLHEEGVHSSTIQPEFVKHNSNSEESDCTMECTSDKSCIEDRCCTSVKTTRKRSPDIP